MRFLSKSIGLSIVAALFLAIAPTSYAQTAQDKIVFTQGQDFFGIGHIIRPWGTKQHCQEYMWSFSVKETDAKKLSMRITCMVNDKKPTNGLKIDTEGTQNMIAEAACTSEGQRRTCAAKNWKMDSFFSHAAMEFFPLPSSGEGKPKVFFLARADKKAMYILSTAKKIDAEQWGHVKGQLKGLGFDIDNPGPSRYHFQPGAIPGK